MKRLMLSVFVTVVLCFNFTVNAATPVECDRECLAGFMTRYLECPSGT